MPRDAVQLLSHMANQTLFVCERVHSDPEQTKIVAASTLKEYEVPIPSSRSCSVRGFEVPTFVEFASQVSLPQTGHSLQWVMTAVTLIERLVWDPSGILIAATYADRYAERSAGNFLGMMRFIEWKEVPAALDSLRLHQIQEDKKQENRGVRWFRPTIQTVIAAAALLVDLCDQPVRKAPRPREGSLTNVIKFEFDQKSFLNVTFAAIKDMAKAVVEAQPGDLKGLRAAVGTRTVAESLVYWPPAGL